MNNMEASLMGFAAEGCTPSVLNLRLQKYFSTENFKILTTLVCTIYLLGFATSQLLNVSTTKGSQELIKRCQKLCAYTEAMELLQTIIARIVSA